MTHGPVLIFRESEDLVKNQTPKAPQVHQITKKYDLLGCAEDILDTWGPGNLVFPRITKDHPGCPTAIKIGDGFIFATDTGKYHWAQEMEDVTNLATIDLKSPLVIGALVTVNRACRLDEAQCRKASANVLQYLGTYLSSWEKSQRQCGIQAGQYVCGQFTQAWDKKKGRPVKDTALEGPDEHLIQYMDEYWGVQVSYCTGVARRVLLRTLVADLMPIFSKCLHFGTHTVEPLREENWRDWFDGLEGDSREKFLKTTRTILTKLRDTGFDPIERNFCVAWPFDGNISRCFKFPPRRQNSWAKILEDSPDCATFAYITMECLETDVIKCGSPQEVRDDNIYFLETAVLRSTNETLSHRGVLQDNEVYFFKMLDSIVWVKAQREQPNQPANLVDLMTIESIPNAIRQRLYLSERRKQRDRLRERPTVMAQGEAVSFCSLP